MSLRVRLLVAAGAVALIALVAADVATFSSLRSFLYHRIDQSLDADHTRLEREIEVHHGISISAASELAGGAYVAVRTPEGDAVDVTPGRRYDARSSFVPRLPSSLNLPPRSSNFGPDPDVHLTVSSQPAGGPSFRLRASILPDGTQLYLALPLNDTIATLHRLLGVELAVTTAALLAAMGIGWWLVRVGLQPLADVEATAAAIAGGDLDRRVPGDERSTEVGHLAKSLNVMLSRIQEAFGQRDATEAALRRSEERLRRFVGDASHELRTPLAAVSAYAELFERGADERPADLARVMRGIRSETLRMQALVEDLLVLARLDEGQPLRRLPVELVGLAAEAVEAARTVGPAWPVRLEAGAPVEFTGDPGRLRQILDNLLTNVRAHNPPGTEATVTVGTDGRWAVLAVTDTGPGLSPEQAERVFERFFRADESRSRLHGGAGLGLSIVAAIATAHGGSVSVGPGPGGGARFEVRLPYEPAPADVDAGWAPDPGPAEITS